MQINNVRFIGATNHAIFIAMVKSIAGLVPLSNCEKLPNYFEFLVLGRFG